jgi:hypothetical protein
MIDKVADIISTISTTDKQEVFFVIEKDAASNANLKSLLNFSGDALVSGSYIVKRNAPLNSVKVILIITDDSQIEIKVCTETTNQIIDLSCGSLAENAAAGRWLWSVLGKSGKINWGDGNEVEIKSISNNTLKHQYSAAGEYTILISGINFDGGDYMWGTGGFVSIMSDTNYHRTDLKIIKEITFKTPQIITNINCLFAGLFNCEKISGTIIIGSNAAASGVGRENFGSLFCTFANSTKLIDISKLMIVWNDNYPLEALQYTFRNCYSLTFEGIKKFKILNSDKRNIKNYQHTFYSCANLKKVPRHLMSPYATKLHSCFHNAGIEFLPSGILDSAESEQHTFANCPLRHISSNLKLDKLTKGLAIFENSYFGYNEVEIIYNALPDYTGTDITPETISMGINCSEEEKDKIRKLLNIDKNAYPDGLPNFPYGETSNTNSKGWPIGFNIH